MLRILFQEPKRVDEGLFLQAGTAIRTCISALEAHPGPEPKAHRLALWSKGFLDALDELEQSHYCCGRYGEKVHKAYLEEMATDELDNYHRFIYFYKNAFIRIFSILDKLGYFMNEIFELKTEKLKSRFSYYTVLRLMHERHLHDALEQQLYNLKIEYKGPMDRLRNQRNMEIHYINMEMVDEISQEHPIPGERIHVENVADHLRDLHKGYEMVCRTLTVAFTYISDRK
jgi:hypothetical protein